MSKRFDQTIFSFGGLALTYTALVEADFAAANGVAYSPPERGNTRRINVARSIQFLSDTTGVVETFQTSVAEVRLPANTVSDSTNDAGDGRLFFFKNSGTGNITIKDYLGTTLWTAKPGTIILVIGNDNNNWDFFDPASDSGASPGFTFGRSGVSNSNTYLLCDTVPSNISGRTVPVTGYIEEVFVAQELTDTFTFKIQKRVGASFTDLLTLTVTASRTANFNTFASVSRGDELAVIISNNSTKNAVIGCVIKGVMA